MPTNTCPRKAAWKLRLNGAVRFDIPRRGPARKVADLFGLVSTAMPSSVRPPSTARRVLYDQFELTLRTGEITVVVGPSGAGKSMLLRVAARRLPRVVELPLRRIARSRRPPVAMFAGWPLARRLELLSCCGLADATALVTPARRLSGGQQHRLAMAAALYRAARMARPSVIVADEFAATLDAATALGLCRNVRRLVGRWRTALLAATPRVELLEHLQPDQVIVKPLGEPPRLIEGGWRSLASHASGSAEFTRNTSADPADWPIERGAIVDYRALAEFHYLAGPPAAHKRVYVVRPPRRGGGEGLLDVPVAAVLVVSPPLRCVRGRNLATAGRYLPDPGRTPRDAMGRLNAEMESISRVIVHPVYRGLGLARRLVRHALATAETPWMEALAVMGHVHPFFERAGMTAHYLSAPHGGARDYVYYLARTGLCQPGLVKDYACGRGDAENAGKAVER